MPAEVPQFNPLDARYNNGFDFLPDEAKPFFVPIDYGMSFILKSAHEDFRSSIAEAVDLGYSQAVAEKVARELIQGAAIRSVEAFQMELEQFQRRVDNSALKVLRPRHGGGRVVIQGTIRDHEVCLTGEDKDGVHFPPYHGNIDSTFNFSDEPAAALFEAYYDPALFQTSGKLPGWATSPFHKDNQEVLQVFAAIQSDIDLHERQKLKIRQAPELKALVKSLLLTEPV